MMTVTRCIRVLVGAILVPTTAMAHPGASIDSIAQGALHPLGGVDHLLAMLSVGALAARAGGRSIWAMPAVFLTSMIAGVVAGANELRLPLAEPVIVLSVLYFGAALLMQHSLPPTTNLVLISLFALFHGHAHGTELTGNSSHVFYGIGLVATTALLHGIGLSMSLLAARTHRTCHSLSQC